MADFACLGSPSGQRVTPKDFVRLATSRYKSKGIFPYCTICREILEVYGVHTPKGASHFDHANRPPEADPLDDCVLARRNPRFRGLEPDGLDEESGVSLRNQFFEPGNLALAYAFCRRMCRNNNLDPKKFCAMVARADKKRIWAYAGIPLWTVPYILLTLENFTAVNARGAEYGFHFIFEKPRGTTASSLWQNSSKCKIVKVFSDTGTPVKTDDNPYPLSISALADKAGDTSWVTADLLRALMP